MERGQSDMRNRLLISFVVSLFAPPLDLDDWDRPRWEEALPELLLLWLPDLQPGAGDPSRPRGPGLPRPPLLLLAFGRGTG